MERSCHDLFESNIVYHNFSRGIVFVWLEMGGPFGILKQLNCLLNRGSDNYLIEFKRFMILSLKDEFAVLHGNSFNGFFESDIPFLIAVNLVLKLIRNCSPAAQDIVHRFRGKEEIMIIFRDHFTGYFTGVRGGNEEIGTNQVLP
ncbi:hypothetical protein D3C72_1070970 [compost metagenome]